MNTVHWTGNWREGKTFSYIRQCNFKLLICRTKLRTLIGKFQQQGWQLFRTKCDFIATNFAYLAAEFSSWLEPTEPELKVRSSINHCWVEQTRLTFNQKIRILATQSWLRSPDSTDNAVWRTKPVRPFTWNQCNFAWSLLDPPKLMRLKGFSFAFISALALITALV